MKNILLFIFMIACFASKAQKIDSMYVNLYTDSLKKGTYNYINVDGLLADGKWLPLDSNHIEFKCSEGKFYGNELWVDGGFTGEKINVSATLKSDPKQHKSFDIYIKKKPDDELLPSSEDIMNNKKKKKNS